MKRNTMKAAQMLAENGWYMEKIEQIGSMTRVQYQHDEIPGLAVIWENNSEFPGDDKLRYTGVPGIPYLHTIDLDDEEVITW